MSCFVSQYAHAPFPAAALDVAHDIALELTQARMCEVERNGEARYAVRGKPLGRQPDMRSKAQATAPELGVQPLDLSEIDRSEERFWSETWEEPEEF